MDLRTKKSSSAYLHDPRSPLLAASRANILGVGSLFLLRHVVFPPSDYMVIRRPRTGLNNATQRSVHFICVTSIPCAVSMGGGVLSTWRRRCQYGSTLIRRAEIVDNTMSWSTKSARRNGNRMRKRLKGVILQRNYGAKFEAAMEIFSSLMCCK